MAWPIVGLSVVLFMAAPALAEPPLPIDIRWEAPPGCPQESDVRDRIQKLLGSRRQDSHLRAEGTIVRVGERFRLELVVRAGDVVGTRRIESNSCEDLAGAAAVELGLLIHSAESDGEPNHSGTWPLTVPPVSKPETSNSPSRGTDAHPSQATGDASPTQRAANNASAESESKADPSPMASQRGWRALVQAPLVALGVGPLPRTTAGVGLSGGIEHANWQLQLNAFLWQRQSVPTPDFPGYGADVDRITGGLWACRGFRFSWFGISPCLTLGLDYVSASGTGRDVVPSAQHMIGMTAGAGVQARLYLASCIRLLVAAGGQVELSKPQISIDGVGSVFQFAPATLIIASGLEWIL